MSDYGELCRDIRAAKQAARRLHGRPCPLCVEKLPRAQPSILLPEQRCKIHGYRDPRKRTPESEYLHRADGSQAPSASDGEGIVAEGQDLPTEPNHSPNNPIRMSTP